MSGFARGLVQAAACGAFAFVAGTAGTWWPVFVENAPQIIGGGGSVLTVAAKMVYDAIRRGESA